MVTIKIKNLSADTQSPEKLAEMAQLSKSETQAIVGGLRYAYCPTCGGGGGTRLA